jgi:hypothetical protein
MASVCNEDVSNEEVDEGEKCKISNNAIFL